jgi:hypothetical protein
MNRFRVAAASFALCFAITSAPGGADIARDAAAVAKGRSLARILLIFRNPGSCGPVLRVQSCLDDLQAYAGPNGNTLLGSIPGIKPQPYDRLRSYILTGNKADIDPALSYINTMSAPKADQRTMQLTDAGIASTLFDAANGSMMWQMLALHVSGEALAAEALADLALVTPEQKAALATFATMTGDRSGPATPAQLPSIIAADAAFVQRVDQTFPAAPIPAVIYDDSAPGFVRLGMALSTLREFLEQPQLGAMPESLAYSKRAIDRIVQLAPSTATDGATALAGFTSSDIAVRRAAAAAISAMQKPLLAALPGGAAGSIVIGALIAQAGYNAAVIQDPAAAATMLAPLAKITLSQTGSSPIVQEMIALRTCAATDFPCQRTASIAFTKTVMQ